MILEEDEDEISDSFDTEDINDCGTMDMLFRKVTNLKNEVSNREEVLKEYNVS